MLNECIAIPLELRDHRIVTMETAGPSFDTGITALMEKVSNSTVTSKLPFSICNVP